jgi:hypothetical protein
MLASSNHETGETSDTRIPIGGPPSTDDDSVYESLSSLTLGSVVSRRRRRASVSTNGYARTHWRRSETDPVEPSRGYFSGYRRRAATSTYSLFGSSISNSNDPQPPLPSLKVIASELVLICSLYCRYALHSLRKPFRRFKRALFLVVFSVLAIALILVAWILIDFYMDAVRVCTPNSNYADTDRPLVEYYVHGRGIGHYARSVAVVENLNAAGVDVRMFLTRAAMWRALHEDAKTIDIGNKAEHVGTTTAISIQSLSPKYTFFETVSHAMERIIGDCEVSAQSGRYPHLIISDGDFPGMIRAEVGGIPSVGIAHGQLFHIAQKPEWIKKSKQLNRAWNDQGRLNGVSSFFSEWQIATHFCFLESRIKTGVVARAPLRPEVLQMTKTRNLARRGSSYPSLPQYDRIRGLLLGDVPNQASRPKQSNSTSTTGSSTRRKLVICYFRDHNGEMVVQALLDSGFDVLLFDNGYYKDMQNDPTRYGVKWIVHDREEERKKQRLDTRNEVHKASVYDIGAEQDHEMSRKMAGDTILGDEHSPRLIRVMDRSLFVPLMHIADGVASSAGSQLMSECIYADMPLLALYLEGDEEQRLNVELSRRPGICHRPKVCGTSFESLATGLKTTNITSSVTTPNLAELKRFVTQVRSSRVSDTFYRYRDSITEDSSVPDQPNSESQESPSSTGGEDPFQGLPDAGAIILEIIKQVVNGD